jgi:hypothetical protein
LEKLATLSMPAFGPRVGGEDDAAIEPQADAIGHENLPESRKLLLLLVLLLHDSRRRKATQNPLPAVIPRSARRIPRRIRRPAGHSGLLGKCR